MQYLTVAEARQRSGLRLVLTTGVPGPWGEAAKAVLKIRGVGYLPVAQQAMAPNEELVQWTGQRNAPIACLNDEPPLTSWLDILLLAERLGTGPSLLPADELDRALCLGLATEIAGTDGFGWNRRHQVIGAHLHGPGGYAVPAGMEPIVKAYGVTPAAIDRASHRLCEILGGLARQLARQAAVGSGYLVGRSLSAADIYWACFSMMVAPLDAAVNPMPDWLRPLYSQCDDRVKAALDPSLLTHRDRVYAEHIGLPLEY